MLPLAAPVGIFCIALFSPTKGLGVGDSAETKMKPYPFAKPTATLGHPVGAAENAQPAIGFGKLGALCTLAIAIVGLLASATGAKAIDPGQGGFWGAAEDFTVISYAGVTNTGNSVIHGNVALTPTPAITGFPPGVITGTTHINDTQAVQAMIDATLVYNVLLALPVTQDLTGQNLGGLTLTSGVYHFNSSALLNGTLTLDTQSSANALFVFQVGSDLTVSANSIVSVIGAGAGTDLNVFWQIGSSATLLSNAEFYGSLVSQASNTLGNGASVENGRVISLTGNVTLDTNDISAVPEPATWAMLAGGIGALGFWQRVRRGALS